MKKILLTGMVGVLFSSGLNATWVHDWSRSLGGTSTEQGQCITSDANNYSISSGIFNGTGNFDPGGTHNLTSAGSSDMYIEKLSNSGTLMWVKQIGGAGVEVPESITLIPGGGDVFVCGRFSGTTDFNYGGTPVTRTSAGGDDIFIARYDVLTGNLVWVYTFGSTGTDQAWDITYDANQLLVCGTVQGKVTFNNYSVTTAGGSKDAFIMRMTTGGAISWIKNFGGTGTDIAYGICTDYQPSGFVYACGTFDGTTDLDPANVAPTITAIGTQDMFCSRYLLSTGAYSSWGWGAGTTNGVQRAKDIAYNYVTGNIYLTGSVSVGTITWPNGGGSYTIAGSTDGFLLCYNPSGSYVWGDGFGSTGQDEGTDIACDQSTANPSAYVYVCGNFSNTVDFDFGGTTTATSNGMLDFFMLRYNGSGTFKDVEGVGGLGRDACYGICANQTMQFIYVTGYYTSLVYMDPPSSAPHTSLGFNDIYHNRYSWTTPARMMNPALAENSTTLSAYPNPATNLLNIDGITEGSVAEIYSADGKLILRKVADNSNTLAIDVAEFENGFYLLRITQPGGAVETKRILIQH